ncbi:MAG: tRNA pseudouridine(38-40) synthase TruA [Nitrospirota bacterium]
MGEEPRLVRVLLEYDGTAYHGWQVQPNARTIQEVFESVLDRIHKRRTKATAAGRTDAGVHARGQVVHFETALGMDASAWRKALNALLPDDIVARGADFPPAGFHARKSALSKTYVYTVLNAPVPSAFLRDTAWRLPFPLDAGRMKEGARFLIGRHDFSSFRSSTCTARHPVRTLLRVDIDRAGEIIRMTFQGDGFLKQMVRSIVGTLVEVGRGAIPPEAVASILEGRRRELAGPTAPARGLCLERVEYPAPYEFGVRGSGFGV